MTAKEFLCKIKKIDLMIENKRAESQKLKDLALNISPPTGGDKIKASLNPHRSVEAVDAYCDIDRDIEELMQERKKIISVIEQLSFTEYKLLYMLYVEFYTLNDVAILNNKSYSWADKLHRKALNNLQIILDD